jgi:hypothetical protein
MSGKRNHGFSKPQPWLVDGLTHMFSNNERLIEVAHEKLLKQGIDCENDKEEVSQKMLWLMTRLVRGLTQWRC